MKTYRYTRDSAVVFVIDLDGVCRLSMLASLVPEGAAIEPADPPPPPTQDELDAAAARQYAKLVALRDMTPEQVAAWIDANVTDFAKAKDAIKTLAIAVGILARRL
jgi:hypothetical protein